jgi:ribonuclease P protein component
MPSATFPPTARLHLPSEYAEALSGRRIGRGALFAVTATKPKPTDLFIDSAVGVSTARLGLIMAKRHAKLATTRNALKRVIRESFRVQRLELPVADYVFRLHKKIDASSLTLLKRLARAEADAHFARARGVAVAVAQTTQ